MNAFSVNRGEHICPDISQLEKDYELSEDDKHYEYNPFSLTQLQPYIPIYSSILDISSETYGNVALNNPLEFCRLNSVIQKNDPSFPKLERSVFIKFSPLLDPIKYMTGKYDISNILNTLPQPLQKIHPKLDNIHNASYVDGFFYYLSSQLMDHYHIPHCIQYYGSHLAIQRKFRMVMDDLDYLSGSTYFLENLGKLFFLSKNDFSEENANQNLYSRGNKPKLEISQISDLNIDLDLEMEIINNNEVSAKNSSLSIKNNSLDLVYELENPNKDVDVQNDDSDDNSSLNYSSDENESDIDISEINSNSGNDHDHDDNDDDNDDEDAQDDDDDDDAETDNDDDDTDDDDDESEEPNIYVYINNFPVQMICLEKCSGTLDELFTCGDIDENNGAAALFQIIMTLIVYQKAFHFTHNDLHTNNIMYVETEEPFLYYNYNGLKYRVPTYGRIYKIIDFGRSIYEWNGKRFCSDSFAKGGDAATQYNCEPFFDDKIPRLEPNYSFDLCRLGVSIYDFVIDENESIEDMDDFQKIIYEWCLDDNGKNILYKKNGMERYPNFKLYKMIARTVHNHSPNVQLEKSIFQQFKISDNKWKKIVNTEKSIHLIDIDKVSFLG
jgi:hypothetical protein